MALNPALERTWHGPDAYQGVQFAPGVKVGYDFTKKINAGFEYYADYVPLAASTRFTISSNKSLRWPT